MDRHPHAAAFRDSLPIAGVDGTLDKRMRGTPAEKRVLAKTGTLAAHQRPRGLRHDRSRRPARLRDVREQPRGASREAVQALDRVAEALVEAR